MLRSHINLKLSHARMDSNSWQWTISPWGMEALKLYLVFVGSYLEDSYQLMRLYELEVREDTSKGCLSVVHGLCGPISIVLSPPELRNFC